MSTASVKLLEVSPLDAQACAPTPPPERAAMAPGPWRPSQFNARTMAADGGLIMWNTYTGAVNAFPAAQRETVTALLKRSGIAGPLTGLAAYLRDRGFLVPHDCDEYRRFQLTFGQQHYRTDKFELILLTSEDCNFRCVYCYETFPRGTMLPWVRTGVKRLLLARAERLSALAVSWFGGEPLYGFDAIEELAPFFQVVAGRHGIRLQHHMTTNGYLLSEDIAAKLLSWDIRDFQITVDGAGHLHDTRRVARDGSKTFDTILRNLRALAKRPDPFTVAIRVNFDKATADALDEFLDTLAADFSYDERFSVVFRPMGAWGGPNDDRLTLCGTEEVRVNMRQFRERAFRRGLHIDTIARIARPGTQVCYAARPYNFIIGAHGQVMKCTVVLDTKDHNIVGTINEDGELTLNGDRMALWTEPSYTTDTTCQKCYLLPPCQGLSCPLVRIEEGRRPCPMCKGDLKGELQLVQLGRPRRAEAPATTPAAG